MFGTKEMIPENLEDLSYYFIVFQKKNPFKFILNHSKYVTMKDYKVNRHTCKENWNICHLHIFQFYSLLLTHSP